MKIAYAIPQDATDVEKGWRNLKARDNDRLADKRLRNLDLVAFAFVGPDDDESDVVFDVQLPTFGDGEDGEEEGFQE